MGGQVLTYHQLFWDAGRLVAVLPEGSSRSYLIRGNAFPVSGCNQNGEVDYWCKCRPLANRIADSVVSDYIPGSAFG